MDKYIIGIDVGGTFTDVVVFDVNKCTISINKVSSTPHDIVEGVIKGLEEAAVSCNEIERFIHGTTVATNAVIERKGAKAGLITTKGFRDVLEIRRTTRGELYNIRWTPPSPLIPRSKRKEVDERTDAFGRVLKEPIPEEVETIVEELKNTGVESVAICFLNSYLNPANEELVRQIIEEKYPDLFTVASAEILPEWREFERVSTTCVGAYVGPLLQKYLLRLTDELQNRGYRGEVLLMLSNGGVSTARAIRKIAPHTLLSGPAAGVTAAKAIADFVGIQDLITMDMGGTSTDIAVIRSGTPLMSGEQEIEFGTIVHLPVIDISTIGAGGGTVAWIDKGGLLHVGPRSAGAEPGPACYGRGGAEPTITDANVSLGRYNPETLLGGKLPIHKAAADRVIKDKIANPLGLPLWEAAEGILEIAAHNIANAIRVKTIERGIDPRDFTLFAFGGAGPAHAARVAELLDISQVLIPSYPGVTSAYGLVFSDIRYDYVKTLVSPLDTADPEAVEAIFQEMEREAINRLSADGVKRYMLLRFVDMRYIGQTHEVTVDVPPSIEKGQFARGLRERFTAQHKKEHGYARDETVPIELVNLRVAAIGLIKKPPLPVYQREFGRPLRVLKRQVYYQGEGHVAVPVYPRELLDPGRVYNGPAIIEQYDTTIVVEPNWTATIDEHGNIWLNRG